MTTNWVMKKSSRRWGAWIEVNAFSRTTGGGAVVTTSCVQESTKWAWEDGPKESRVTG